jgi:hypothetical protein
MAEVGAKTEDLQTETPGSPTAPGTPSRRRKRRRVKKHASSAKLWSQRVSEFKKWFPVYLVVVLVALLTTYYAVRE